MRLSAIGDVCHAVAMVTRIQMQSPDTEITWIIGKIEYQLVGDMPGIRFIVFDKALGKAAFKQLQADVNKELFDCLFVMQVAFRANMAARLIRAKQKLGFDWNRSKEMHWLFTNKRIAPQKHAHVLDGFMAFADAINIPEVTEPQWHIPLEAADKEWAMAQKQQLGDFVVISPAASKAERNWLPQRYAQICDYLSSKGKQVILCGGPAQLDRDLANEIVKHTQNVTSNYTAKTSLKQLLALLQQASLVIAPDTGPAHMATTVGTPVIGLYAHSNPRRTGPYNNLHRVVSVYDSIIEQQKNKHWKELKWGVRAKGETLMEHISVEMVTAKIDDWFTEQQADAS